MTSRDLLALGLKGLGVYLWVKVLVALPAVVETIGTLTRSELSGYLMFAGGDYALRAAVGMALFLWSRPLARLLGEEDDAQVRLEMPPGWQQQATTLGLQVAGILLVLFTISSVLYEVSKWSRAGALSLKYCAPCLITGAITCGIGLLLFAHRRVQGWFAAKRKEWAEIEGPGAGG